MMVSFHYILIVATLVPFALGGDNLNCNNKTKSIRPWEMCCDGDIYRMGELIWPEASCDVEPKNATLTFADSAWLAYDCNVRKRLNSTDLTLQSYLRLLLRVRKSSQRLLWETLKFQSDISKRTGGEDEYDKIQTIKLYHSEILEALGQACIFGDLYSTVRISGLNWASIDFKTRFARWQSYQECNEEMLPYSGYFASYDNRPALREYQDECKQEFYNVVGNVTSNRDRQSISTICRVSGPQNLDKIKAEIIKPTLDLDGLVGNFFPAFWSKRVKNSAKNYMFQRLKQDYHVEDLENLESLMRNKIEERINQKLSEGESATNKRGLVQAIMIFSINDIFLETARNICRIDAHGQTRCRKY